MYNSANALFKKYVCQTFDSCRYRIELPDDDKWREARRENNEGWEENGGTNAGGTDRIVGAEQTGRKLSSSSSSSSDNDEGGRRGGAFPVIQIDMKGYGY